MSASFNRQKTEALAILLPGAKHPATDVEFDQDLLELVRDGANPNDPGVLDALATLTTKFHSRLPVISLMLAAGMDPNAKGASGRTVFERLCGNSDSEGAALVLRESKTPVDLLLKGYSGFTVMALAAYQLNTSALQAVQDEFERRTLPVRPDLARNHLWTSSDDDGQNIPMLISDRPATLGWLMLHPDLDMRSTLEHADKHGRTLLRVAVDGECTASVPLLLSLGASIEAKDSRGVSVFEAARDAIKDDDEPDVKRAKREIFEAVSAVQSARAAARAIDDVIKSGVEKGAIPPM